MNQPSDRHTVAPPDAASSAHLERAASPGFRHVLVCLDRSAVAEAALPLAYHLARVDGARITLLHVLAPPSGSAEGRATDALDWEILRQEAHSYLDRIAAAAADLGIEVDSRLAEGAAAPRVAALAAELDVDLVVFSTYGEGGLEAWTLGSTAQKILALAHGPVLIVPSGVSEPLAQVPPRRILVPLDGSVRGECVLPTALRLARGNDAEIVLAHVVPDPIRTELLSTEEDVALAETLADRLAARAESYLGRLRATLAASQVRARTVVSRCADHREGVVTLAASERADLVALSAHGAICNPRRRFGSVTAHVIAHSMVPVLVIQDLPHHHARPAGPFRSRLPPRSVDATLDRH